MAKSKGKYKGIPIEQMTKADLQDAVAELSKLYKKLLDERNK